MRHQTLTLAAVVAIAAATTWMQMTPATAAESEETVKQPIIFQVDRIRDGRSFTTRRVVAMQHGKAILNMAASFQIPEEGLSHQAQMPDVPPPEECANRKEMAEQFRGKVSDDLLVAWWFGGAFREMAEKSCHWAIMDRQTVFALSSKYSILLFQHIASMVNLDHVTSKTFTVSELRAVLGVAEGKLDRFADLNRRALEAAISEINQTSRLTLTATPRKVGRTVASITIAWEEKPQEAKQSTKRELDRPKVGRKARRNGMAETPAAVFPDFGSVKGAQPWDQIAQDNAPRIDGRHVPDLRVLADSFRKWCGEKSIPLDASTIEKIFTTWTKSYSAR